MKMQPFLKNKIHKPLPLGFPIVNENCTEFEVNNWVISEFVVEHLVPIINLHPFPITELHLMVSAVCRIRPVLILEWGTHIGKSARIFYETINKFNIPCKIHTVDLPDNVFHQEAPHEKIGMYINNIPEISCHRGDGIETSIKIWNNCGTPRNIIFFLDGDHSYETVNRELKLIIDQAPASPKGILIHDTFYQSEGSGYNIGPYKAIQDNWKTFENEGYKIYSSLLGLPGITLIYKL